MSPSYLFICKTLPLAHINLTFDGPFSYLSFDGGGAQSAPPPLFLFVKTLEKVIRLCTVLKKKGAAKVYETIYLKKWYK